MRFACLRLVGTLLLVYSCDGVAHFHNSGRGISRPPLLFAKNNATSTIKRKRDRELKCVDGVCSMRGGSADEYDDDYDDEEGLPPPRRTPSKSSTRRSSSSSGKQRPPARRSSRGPPPRYDSRRGPPPGRGPPRRRGPPPPRRRRRSALSGVTGLAKKTVDLTAAATVSTLKGSGKAAYYLVSPKHVTRREVWGVWRLDQQVDSDTDSPISCAANVEFTPRGDVLVKYQDRVFETTYLFREKSWPKSCVIEFEARAFQGPHDDEPVLVRYKGYFRRKLADSRIIKIVGNIYEVPRKGSMWRRGRAGRKIGTFVARRRLVKKRREELVEEEVDEYDDEEEYDLEEIEEEEYDEEEFEDNDEYDE